MEQLVNNFGKNAKAPVVQKVIAAGKNGTKLDKLAAHIVVHTIEKNLGMKNETNSKNGTKIEIGGAKNGTAINGKIDGKNSTGNGTKIEIGGAKNSTVINGKVDGKNTTGNGTKIENESGKNATIACEKTTTGSKNGTVIENGKNSTSLHEPIGKNATITQNATAKVENGSAAKNATVINPANTAKNSTTKAVSKTADDKQSPAAKGDAKGKSAGPSKIPPGQAKKLSDAAAAGKKGSNKANAPGQKAKTGAPKK